MRLLRQTGSLKLVSRMLGHADVSTTIRSLMFWTRTWPTR